MSTDRRELLDLQDKARRAGRTVTFFRETEDGPIDGVFYIDPKMPAPARSRVGILLDPLTFAEIERTKPVWYKMPESYLPGSTLGALPELKTFTVKTPLRSGKITVYSIRVR